MAPRGTLKRYGFTALVATIVGRFGRLHNRPYRSVAPDGTAYDRNWIGDYGERASASWLRESGHILLARNFKGRNGGEVDIIARHGKLLLFIEVKTRNANTKIRPFDAVNKEKQLLIERGANQWLKRLGTRDLPWRFDVIEVLVTEGRKPSINHIKDAF